MLGSDGAGRGGGSQRLSCFGGFLEVEQRETENFLLLAVHLDSGGEFIGLARRHDLPGFGDSFRGPFRRQQHVGSREVHRAGWRLCGGQAKRLIDGAFFRQQLGERAPRGLIVGIEGQSLPG